MYNNFSLLVDKKLIESPTLSDDKCSLTFKTEKYTITLFAEGECCSNSWVEHFDIIPAGETIKSVVEKEVERIENAEYECLQKYFYEIITDKGSYTIEMRNSSNGYYGGIFNSTEASNQ